MFVRRYRIQLRLLIASCVLTASAWPAGLRAADEQAAEPEETSEYEIMPLQPWMLGDTPQDKKRRNDLDIRKEAILRGSEPFEAQTTKDYLQTYYSRYYFALLTHPKNIADWPKVRVTLGRTLASPNLQEPPLLQVHDFLVDLVYQTMLPLIRGNYHPAARCNAMLLLGSLNSQDPVFVGDKKRPPVPLIQSLKVMLDELGNDQQVDGVRAAALVGILRHVEIDRQLANQPGGQRRLLGNNAETTIVDAMLNLINATEPPADRSPDGHTWMRRRAVEILGYLGSPGPNDRVLTALDGILADNKAPVPLRCSAAEAFGRLQFPANAKLAVAELSKKLATVAVLACQKELQRVEDQEAEEAKAALTQPGAMGGSYGMDYGTGGGYMESGYMGSESMDPGYGMMPEMTPGYGTMPGYGMPSGMPAAKFNPLGYRILLTRRRIAHQLLSVKRGLLGPEATLKAGAPSGPAPTTKSGLAALVKAGADQTALDNAVSGIDAIIREVEKSTFNEMKPLTVELRAKVRQLEDKCGIVVELPEESVPGATPDSLLSNPLELPADIPGLEMPEIPNAAPGAEPAGQPAEQPTVPAPEVPAPAAPAPDASTPTPAVPVPEVPAPAVPAPAVPAPAVPAPAGAEAEPNQVPGT